MKLMLHVEVPDSQALEILPWLTNVCVNDTGLIVSDGAGNLCTGLLSFVKADLVVKGRKA